MKTNNKKVLLTSAAIASLFIGCDNNDNESSKWILPDIGNSGIELPYSVLKKVGDVEVRNGGYGSAATAHPTNEGEFYALTDRGANLKTSGGKIFPTPDYTPRIGHFKLLEDKTVVQLAEILLKNPAGVPVSGRPNPEGYGATGEIPYDLNKSVLAYDKHGIDSEGLVALKDGSFWVSDEYGPHIVHFDATGKELERISPVNVNTGNRKIPAVFERRWANRGMEGLAITPDEKTLVGIMQSTLYNPSKKEVADFTITRIVTFDIATATTKQYLYKQEKAKNSNSEITALSNTEFLVIERDGNFQGSDPTAQKFIYKIDISNATDVSGDSFNDLDGMLVNNKTIEQNTWDELSEANITPVSKTLAVDVTKILGSYPYEKMEGIWLINGTTIGILNDDDFAVTGTDVLNQKILPGTDKVDQNTLYITNF
ncbi:esterase-like activity of phytase family protein [Tenacibaculum finnmarkense]|uniref:esterase-like activity of phytase family protein n=1 Tax=Tenacibaculum finnmarkense TaxID=2781243 RepID=UPI001E613DA5|nr:esterase-like activity of phytase family protein [Tenacibaculum finnmarkense]MCD8410567.1 esterase-like activity of phytase family protein [Tenacibaculum finnmarkense genomovar ulcerans]